MALPVPIKDNKKEVFYEGTTNNLIGNSAVHFIFPPLSTYNNGGEILQEYVNRPNDKIVNADVAFLRLSTYEDTNQDNSWPSGDFGKTNVAGAFYAVAKDDYFYVYTGVSSTLTAPSLERGNGVPRVAEAISIPSSSIGVTFENKSLGMITQNVCRYDDMEVDGLNEGYKPTNQPMTVIRLEDQSVEDVTLRCFDAVPTTRQTISNASAVASLIDADLVEELDNEFVSDKALYNEFTDYVGAIEIVNIERELDDYRYGDAEDDLPFIFTGASYYFDDTEIATLQSGTPSLPIDIEVWGGDCFIGLHTFKITDSTYSLTDGTKDVDESTKAPGASQTSKWEYYFKKSIGAETSEDISRPYPLKGVAQTITVLLESEVNPEFIEKAPHNKYDYDVTQALSSSNLPVPTVDDAGQIRSKFKYRISPDYVGDNTQKVFFPFKTFEKNQTLYGSRLLYSDTKIYNTEIEGFDRFRVGNTYDLDETHGAITALVELNDRIFGVQEGAVSYIPMQSRVIETTEGGQMNVRSDIFIDVPVKINTLYGSQHLRTIKKDGTQFYFADQRRGEVCVYDGESVKLISRVGMEDPISTLLATATDRTLNSYYDNKKKEYILSIGGSASLVYNAVNQGWFSYFPETATTKTLGGGRVEDTMLLIGIGVDTDLNVGKLYSSSAGVGSWWGTTFTPYVKLWVNPETDMVKTFDAFTIVSDRTIAPQSFVVDNNGTTKTGDLSSTTPQYQEGTFRFKNVRDASDARLRGTHGLFTINFITTEQSGMTSVISKYRTSYRPI